MKRTPYKYWISALLDGKPVSGDTAPTLRQAVQSAKSYVVDGCREVHIWPAKDGDMDCSGDPVRSFYGK